MPDEGPSRILEFHRDDIKPAGDIPQFRMFGQIAESDFPDLTAFAPGDCFLGETAVGIGPCFYFEKNQGRVIIGDDVDFPVRKAVPPFDYPESFPYEKTDGRFFAAAA
jgi:hypothetical protein